MSRRIIVLVASAILVTSGVTVAGAALVPAVLGENRDDQSQASTMNTAAQNSLGNAGAFVDVTDNPVSLPSEKTIQPPRTGSAGILLPERGRGLATFALTAVALMLVAGSRLVTRERAPR